MMPATLERDPPTSKHRVVVIGGGFGGLAAVQALAKAPVDVTLIDRRNFHLFQPLLYQVATGGLSPANIAAPLRAILKRQRNARVLMGEVVAIDAAGRRVLLADGASVPYDSLIVAAGMRDAYFGHDEWAASAPGLKTVEDAVEMRRRIFSAFEAAERAADAADLAEVRRWLTFVVIGAGPTGVELAGALSELARHTLAGNFRHIDPATAQVHLIEGAGKVLPVYGDDLAGYAARALAGMGVQVHLNTLVTTIDGDALTLRTRDGGETVLHARTILWAAGVRASGLAEALQRTAGAELDRSGRVKVGPDLSIPGHPELFVIGDMANFTAADGKPLPGLAQVAIQQGKYAARLIAARIAGKATASPVPFVYRDLGTMATIGRAAAVADLRFVRAKGLPAWLIWLFVHLMSLVSYQNRALVFAQWAWTYVTRNRTARLITGPTAQNVPSALSDQTDLVGERDGADRQPGPGAEQQHVIAAADAPGGDGLGQRQRDGSGDAVAAHGQVDKKLVGAEAKPLR